LATNQKVGGSNPFWRARKILRNHAVPEDFSIFIITVSKV